MAEWFEVEGGLDDMRTVAQRIRDAGHALNDKTRGVLDSIKRIEAGEPWGTDHFRDDFLAGYRQPVGGDGTGPAFDATVHDGLANAGLDLAKAGDDTMSAMAGYQAVEHDNTAQLANVRDKR
jgi:hypothetical protein